MAIDLWLGYKIEILGFLPAHPSFDCKWRVQICNTFKESIDQGYCIPEEMLFHNLHRELLNSIKLDTSWPHLNHAHVVWANRLAKVYKAMFNIHLLGKLKQGMM